MKNIKNNILKTFIEISKIPRCSGINEHKPLIENYLKNFAEAQNLNFYKDSYGNIFITNYKSKDSDEVIFSLQAHTDMVCQSTNNYDFNKGINVLIDQNSNIIRAKNTSLGADNGLGVAILLNIIKEFNKKIQLIFTTDEEIGLIGAQHINSTDIEGDILINIDSEKEDEIIIGCAGGRDYIISGILKQEDISKSINIYKLSINNLKGGHSGIDINKKRLNAIKVITQLLQKIEDIEIIEFFGGSAHNAIPRDAYTIFASRKKINESLFNDIKDQINKENGLISLEKFDSKFSKALSNTESKALLNFLENIPHGVLKTQQQEVITSANLAIINYKNGYFETIISTRSLFNEELNTLEKELFNLALHNNFNFVKRNSYPPWSPENNKEIYNILHNIYYETVKFYPIFKTIHAGLECGYFKEKKPNLPIFSIGPTIENPHSPSEIAYLNSAEKIYRILCNILSNKDLYNLLKKNKLNNNPQ